MTLRDYAYRSRYALLALVASVLVHAMAIVGVPGRAGEAPPVDDVRYTAELVPAPGVTASLAPAPAPRIVRPRSPRKPREAIATLPLMPSFAPEAAVALRELEPPLPDLAPPEPAKPEVVASVAPATVLSDAKAAPFPVHALPADLSIRYALTSPFADGTAHYSWKREGDRYVISGSAEAEGFFTLFLEGRILQESSGTVTESGLRPDRFVERKPQGPEESLTFDWVNRTVEFQRNGEVKPSGLADNTVDWLSMIFQLAHEPPKGDSLPMKVYTQRKLYTFDLKVLGVEVIELPIGTVKALHLRHTAQDSREQVDVWLGVDQHYLPVKMRYPVARNRFMVEQTATSISGR